jgi:hypothetical protein
MAVLQNLTQIDPRDARIAELEAKLANARRPQALTIRVSSKGGVSVYGLGKWPITLYRTQWTRLLGEAKAIGEFIEENAAQLATKD